ncbi:MAG: ATP-binding cassette domain-containing protein, partial [Lachnospiraceae bacterium]|nr:ATP-binding cassette domain-containing protein [Lachnospiraceae bacterium]
MGWFDEQINKRKKTDTESIAESLQNIANAVTGDHMSEALNHNRQLSTDAIAEILKYYKLKPSEVPDSLTDMNEVLEYLLHPQGFMRRNVRLDKGWYKDAAGAMLGTKKDDDSVVALIPLGPGRYRYYDRNKGKYVTVNGHNEDEIKNEAIAFYRPFPNKAMNTSDLIRYMTEQISPIDIFMLILAMTAATCVGMLLPKLNAILFSDVLRSGSIRMLAGMGLVMISISLSLLMFRILQGFASARISTKLNISVEAASMMRILSLPPSFFKRFSAGELAGRVGSLGTLSDKMVSMALSTGLSSIFSLVYITQIFKYAPALVIPSLTITLLTVLVSLLTVMLQIRVLRSQMGISVKESSICHSYITGIQKIRLSGAEKRAFAKWADIYAKCAAFTYNPPMMLRVSGVIIMAITMIGAMVLYYGAIKSGVSVAEYYAFTTAYGMVDGAFLSLSRVATGIAQIKPSLEMAKPILNTVPETGKDKIMVTSLRGGVELNNVSFRYRKDMPLILDNVSLKIRPGQYVAIVGKTGCGKSTLMRILLGFEKPQKGAVYYDGRDLNSLDPQSLRRRIGSVTQDGKLLSGDVYSNIVISAPWLTVNDAWEAAETAGFADDIRNMPMGMNTMLSEGQGGISGGQRQRLMIARAIVGKPKILMFDEATSALDNIT